MDNLARVVNFYQLESSPPLIEIYNAASIYCATPWSDADGSHGPLDSVLLENYCFEGMYAFLLLTEGFGLSPLSSQVTFAGELYGVDVSWAWGAMTDQVVKWDLN